MINILGHLSEVILISSFSLSQIMFKHPLCPLFIARSIEFIFVFILLIMGLINSEIEINTKQYTDGMSFPQNLEEFYMDPKKIGNVYGCFYTICTPYIVYIYDNEEE